MMPRGPLLRERLDQETLEKLYHQSGLTTVQIGERYGTGHAAVIKLMAKYGVPRRPRGRKTWRQS
jgi:hypothetical protein